MKGKITKRGVESIKPGARDVFLWDTEIPGFGVKVTRRRNQIEVTPGGNPELVKNAPHTTPGRLDEVKAARQLNLRWVPHES